MAVRHCGEKSKHDYLRHIDQFLAMRHVSVHERCRPYRLVAKPNRYSSLLRHFRFDEGRRSFRIHEPIPEQLIFLLG
jgi:hypothetical protein